jgi:peroxiredoxin (alkyl hydroperoxide reductase subunit C)
MHFFLSPSLSSLFEVATPADWRPGDEVVILPTVPEDEAKKLFPQGYKTVKPYLRLVKVDKK